MEKKKFRRFTIYLDEGDSPILDELKRLSSKYRLSVSALASYAMQAGLPSVEAHFEKIGSKPKREKSQAK